MLKRKHACAYSFEKSVFFQKELGLKSFKKSSRKLKSSRVITNEEEDGRDIGAMVSVLTKAIQQLLDKNDKQDKEIAELKLLLNKSPKK